MSLCPGLQQPGPYLMPRDGSYSGRQGRNPTITGSYRFRCGLTVGVHTDAHSS